MLFTTKALLASALALAVSAQDDELCSAPENTTGLLNTDTNVGFVRGYYGLANPTVAEQDGVQALPWSYPLDKCTMVLASGTLPYWKFMCADDGTVVAQNFADDYTCTGDVVEEEIIDSSDPNNTLSYNCAADATEAWFRAQMYVGACSETPEAELNTYGVVGEGQCVNTQLSDGVYGWANFYCDKQGLALNTYELTTDMCAGSLCQQGTIDEGECEFLISALVSGVPVAVYARPLECMSAQDDICRDDSACPDDGAAAGVATTAAVVVSAVAAAWRLM